MDGRELLTPYQSEDLRPKIPTHRMYEENGKSVRETKREHATRPKKCIDPALDTRQSHTILYGVTKIIS